MGTMKNKTLSAEGSSPLAQQAENVANVAEKCVTKSTKYTPELVDKLLGGLADGLNFKQACVAVGIHENTLRVWREKYPELQERMSEAREAARQKALAAIQAAGERDWRAHEAWLRLSFPDDYRRPDARIAVSATATAQQATRVLITPEDRKAVREQRERIIQELQRPLEQPKLQQAGAPIGGTNAPQAPEDPFERAVSDDIAERLGRFGNID
jgi:hypothetical protein